MHKWLVATFMLQSHQTGGHDEHCQFDVVQALARSPVIEAP